MQLALFEVQPDVSLNDVWQTYKLVRKLKQRTVLDYEKRLKYVPELMAAPVRSVTKAQVLTMYMGLSEANGEATASYVFRILRALVEFTREVLETTDGAPVVVTNPVKALSATRSWAKTKHREDYLKPSQMKPWLAAVLRYPNTSVSDWLLFCLLTGCRRNEATRLTWNCVDFANGLVTFMSTKNGKNHTIPASREALEMLYRRRLGATTNPYVFTGMSGGKLSDWCKAYLDIGASAGVEFTVHGLRRTWATVADSIDIPKTAIAHLLNHSSRSITDAYIQPSPERLRKHTQAVTNEVIRLAEAENALLTRKEGECYSLITCQS